MEAKKVERLGETRMMNCGMNATIVKYLGCRIIEVKFEDGSVVHNQSYDSFVHGEIEHPTPTTN